MFRFRRLSLRQSVVAVMAFSVLVQRRTTLAAESDYRRTLGFLSILNVLNILSVLWVLGILEVRGLLRVLRTLRILRILRILAVLMLCCLRLNLLAQAAHVGSCKNAVLLLFSFWLRSLLLMEITFFSSRIAIISSSYIRRIKMGPRIIIRMP